MDLVKQCVDLNQALESEATDLRPEHRSIVHECTQTLSKCLSILTNTSNLYTVQFGDLDSDSHRDIVQAFLNDHNSSPADWTRVTTAAYTRGFDDICWNSHQSYSGVSSQQQGDTADVVGPINAYFDSSVVVTPFGSYLSTDGITATPSPCSPSGGLAAAAAASQSYHTAPLAPAALPGSCTVAAEGAEEAGEEASRVDGENGVKATFQESVKQGGGRPASTRGGVASCSPDLESRGGRERVSVSRRASVGRVRDRLTSRGGTPASRIAVGQQQTGRVGFGGGGGLQNQEEEEEERQVQDRRITVESSTLKFTGGLRPWRRSSSTLPKHLNCEW